MEYFVYILTNKIKITLYIGVTNNLERRLQEHSHPLPGSNSFTKRYNIFYLVHFESYQCITVAIAREKEIKKWRREKKDALISQFNPQGKFLNELLENG